MKGESDPTGSRRWARQGLSIVSSLACGVLVGASYFAEDVELAVAIITLGSCIAALAGPCAYTASIDMGGRYVTQVFSIMNTAGNIGAAAFPYVAPRLVGYIGSWDAALILFAALFIGAAISWLPINPDREMFPEDRDAE